MSKAIPTPWTREQIDAWVDLRTGDRPRDTDEARTMRAARRTIVRLCPEALDYHRLSQQLNATGLIIPGHATDAEQAELTKRAIATLWVQSISEPVESEAPR